MCGVFGFIQKTPQPFSRLFNGLKMLEYRGYDSVGVAFMKDDQVVVCKDSLPIDQFCSRFMYESDSIHLAIGHTRWATHGRPSARNAHPHCDSQKTLALVHNGIIENSDVLGQFLQDRGVVLSSDTDSELLAHLIAYYYDDDLKEAIFKTLEQVEGSLGLMLFHKDHPDQIVVVSLYSPIVIGKSENGFFMSSDVHALSGISDQIFALHDHEVGFLSAETFHLYDKRRQRRQCEFRPLDKPLVEYSSAPYDHFMLKEIMEQPAMIRQTVDSLFNLKKGCFSFSENQDLELALRRTERIVIIGCGTSWHAALIGKYYLEQIMALPVTVEYATEFPYKPFLIKDGTLIIAISQSGETADTVSVMRKKYNKDIFTIGICNIEESSLTRLVDHVFLTHVGIEIGVASTKAFTGQIVLLYMFAIYMSHLHSYITKERVFHFLKILEDMLPLTEKVLDRRFYIEEIVKKYVHSSNMLYLGRGLGYFIALEGALKMKEVSYVHAEGCYASEMKHGPIALVDSSLSSVVLALQGRRYQKILNNMSEIKSRDGRILALATEGDTRIRQFCDDVIYLPYTHSLVSGMIAVLPLQLLSYYMAVLRRCDVDKPRNLAKSVTVE